MGTKEARDALQRTLARWEYLDRARPNDPIAEDREFWQSLAALMTETTVWKWDVFVAKCAEQLLTLANVEVRHVGALADVLARQLAPFLIGVEAPPASESWTDAEQLVERDWEPVEVWLVGTDEIVRESFDLRARLLDDPTLQVRECIVAPLRDLSPATREELLDPEGPYAGGED